MNTRKQYEGPPIEEGAALALSGGGFRAMLYHVGALWRLNELGLLNTLDRLASVSGGALLAGCLAARWSSLRFDDSVAMNLREQVFEDVLRLSRRLIDIPAGLAGFLPLMSAASAARKSRHRLRMTGSSVEDTGLSLRVGARLHANNLPPNREVTASGTMSSWRTTNKYCKPCGLEM